ncbi:MAG: hypothetical protein PSU94_01605 [Lacunisphaera sp.]|nr:hypothetical protein [Lacunisphaera sp.]
MKAYLLAVISGTVWTVIAALILWQPEFWGQLHEIRWLACVAGPFIGLGLYYCSRWSDKKKTGIRIVWSVVSLYLAAGVYGLVLGLLVWPSRNANTTPEALLEPVMACWYGITLVPFLWPFFGLSFLNHQVLRCYDERCQS